MRDRYALTDLNSVANAFAYRGLTTLAELAGWVGRPADVARFAQQAAALRAAINLHMWNGSAYCDGVCANTSAGANHTAFHSTVYLLAAGVPTDDTRDAAWRYVRGRITPPFGAPPAPPPPVPAPVEGGSRPADSWPPPPPPGARDGMPCSTMVAQFVLQAPPEPEHPLLP